MTNLDILPVDKYHELKSKWQNSQEFKYEYRHNKFSFRIEGFKSYKLSDADPRIFLVSFHISEGTSGTGLSVYSNDKDIQDYNSLFEFLEPRIRPYIADFQIVDEQQLCLF